MPCVQGVHGAAEACKEGSGRLPTTKCTFTTAAWIHRLPGYQLLWLCRTTQRTVFSQDATRPTCARLLCCRCTSLPQTSLSGGWGGHNAAGIRTTRGGGEACSSWPADAAENHRSSCCTTGVLLKRGLLPRGARRSRAARALARRCDSNASPRLLCLCPSGVWVQQLCFRYPPPFRPGGPPSPHAAGRVGPLTAHLHFYYFYQPPPLVATSRPYLSQAGGRAPPNSGSPVAAGAQGRQAASASPTFRIHRISGDGACMFRAVVQGAQYLTHGSPMPQQAEAAAALNLRQAVVRELRTRRE